MTLEDRLARLERQNRWMKCAGVVLVGLLLIGQSKPQDIIAARGFVLVDEAGNARGAFGMKDGGPQLALTGDDSVAVIGVLKGGPGIILTDGTRRVSLGHYAGGELGLSINSEDGMAQVMVAPTGSRVLLKTQPGPEQVMAALGAAETSAMFSADSKLGRVILGTDDKVGPALVLTDPDKKIVFAAP